MSQAGNNDNQFSGPYMIQDRDHAVSQSQGGTKRTSARQSEQSHSETRQQGGEQANRKQPSGRRQQH